MKQADGVLVRAEGLSKTYRPANRKPVTALQDLSFAVSRGQMVIVGGPSGSGKTTLLNLVGCLDLPSQGRLIIDGEDVTGFSEEALCRVRRGKIGFVFQEFHLLSRMTAWENAAVPLVPLGMPEKERFRRAGAILDSLGLHERLHHRPEELSGGEQQRVALARALVLEPELLLADEPTSNIDAESVERVLNALADLKDRGCTVVVATHDANLFLRPPSGRPRADLTILLAGGRIESLRS